MKDKKNKVKRKIDKQAVFNVISFGFILGCCVFYGGRFIKLYKENNKEVEVVQNTLSQGIKNDNFSEEYFSNVFGEYYFVNDVDKNYVKYSNILWRILKINSDNELVLVSDKPLTSLAFNPNSEDYLSSDVNKWMNTNDEVENTGILEGQLNNKAKYLVKNKVCIDEVNEIKNTKCSNYNGDNYINLLSINDYINSGADKSYINNDTNFYLANLNKDKEVWYVNDSKKLATSDKEDLLGIKVVITINSSVEKVSGDGTINNPYMFEQEKSLFGSYVKINEDIWQIYDVKADSVNLVLNNYLMVNGKEVLNSYSQVDYRYNPKSSNSLANYLNNKYLTSLPYQGIININSWKNSNYDLDNEDNYNNMFSNVVNAKVGLLSIGDIIINNDLTDYSLMSGRYSLIYNYHNNGTLKSMNITTKNHVVPTININKSLINEGEGTIESPYVIKY